MTTVVKILLLLLAINTQTFAEDGTTPLSFEDRVDNLFRSYQGTSVPGAAVAVVKDGVVLLEKGYGCAKLNPCEPVTAATNFRLASVTKHMTAMAIMILKDRGLLNYDDKITRFFPNFPNYGNRITVEHMLHHTSGLVEYETIIPSSQTNQVSDHDVLQLLSRENSTYFTPGSQYRYSNGGYVLLGLIVEAVSGQTFAQFLSDEIFTPLGMHNTRAYVSPGSDITNRAYGHTASGGGYRQTDQSVTSATLGDGGVYMNAHDYFLWDQALYSNSLVSDTTLAMAFASGRLNSGSLTNYGFGWNLGQYSGHTKYSHTGSTIGFRSGIARYPEDNLGIIVMVNRANSSPWDIATDIADIVFDSFN